jgi:hypothetical protein
LGSANTRIGIFAYKHDRWLVGYTGCLKSHQHNNVIRESTRRDQFNFMLKGYSTLAVLPAVNLMNSQGDCHEHLGGQVALEIYHTPMIFQLILKNENKKNIDRKYQ